MYKDILVCISEAQGRENLISTAAQFAVAHGARLNGVFVSIHHDMPLPPFGLVAVDQVLKAADHDKQLYADAVEQFREISRQQGADASWIADTEAEPPLQAAKYMDIVVASQLQDDLQSGDSSFSLLNSLVLESGKPVLLVPKDWQKGAPGKNIVLGWDQTREAARAVGDSLSLMQAADKVDVITVVPANEEVANLSRISDYLGARGVTNEFHAVTRDKEHKTTAQAILHKGESLHADLYILGGYGHSKIREIVLGGVTRHMMQNSNAPVLLSH